MRKPRSSAREPATSISRTSPRKDRRAKLSPSATKLTYKRKKGKVVFTLNARFSNAYSLPYNAATTYLQGSKNGKTKWANKIKLTTNADGRVGAKITAKKKSVGYYRWATKVGSVWTYGKVQKVTIK